MHNCGKKLLERTRTRWKGMLKKDVEALEKGTD